MVSFITKDILDPMLRTKDHDDTPECASKTNVRNGPSKTSSAVQLIDGDTWHMSVGTRF